jgi:hypothetical protein
MGVEFPGCRSRGRIFGVPRIALALACFLGTWSAAAGESEHVTGPDGLVGWKVTYLLENQEEVSDTLIIARNGARIRTLHGDPLIWTWMFQGDGKSLAFESGPLHFAMACVLIDIASGKELQRVDCFTYPEHPPAGGWPAWLAKLMEAG